MNDASRQPMLCQRNAALRAKLEDEGTVFQTSLDTESMANLIAKDGLRSYQAQSSMQTALCVFIEYVSFARPDSESTDQLYRSCENMDIKPAQIFSADRRKALKETEEAELSGME